MKRSIQKPVIANRREFEAAELRRLKFRVTRLFAALEEVLEFRSSESITRFSPNVDIVEKGDRVEIYVELPGVRIEDIDLLITTKEITIEGQKLHAGNAKMKSKYLYCERLFGRFKRVINLHWTVSLKETTAELSDGTLRITLPKLTDRRGKAIKIPIQEK